MNTAAQEGKRAVVIGSSFISMELVMALSKRKLASIDVIGMEEYPFEAILGKEVGAGLKKVSTHALVVVTFGRAFSMDECVVPRVSRCQVPHANQSGKDCT